MVYKQIGSFGNLAVIGLDFTLSRGPRPSCCHIRVPHYQDEDLTSATSLSIKSNDEEITFDGMVGDISTIRPDWGPEHKREWIFSAWDRRQSWSKGAINGDYNVRYRDCTIKPSTKKSLQELQDLLFVAVDEPEGSKLSDATVYPRAVWRNQNVPDAFERLSATYPAWVCRDNEDAFVVRQTGDGMELPDNSAYASTIPDFQATVDIGPEKVICRCGPTLFQCFLELEAVGRDIDGKIKLIDDLSYKPTAGWAGEDPLFFSGVDIDKRHLALKTVYKLFRVKVQSVPGCTVSVSDVMQFDLDNTLVSMAGSADDKDEIPAFVKGKFWPQSVHFKSTGPCVHYAGDIKIDNTCKCVEFEYPVYDAGSCIAPPQLWLITGFRVRDPDTWDFVRKEFEVTRDSGTGEQVLDHPELWETVVESFLGECANSGSPTKNTSTIQEEADQYTGAWKDHWDKIMNVRDIEYSGTLPLSMSGNIAQITYRLFRGLPPITRASTYDHNALLR